MVKDRKQHTVPRPAKQGVDGFDPEPNRIRAGTPYNFEGRNLTAYAGLLPVATMLEKLGFQELIDGALTVKRQTKVMTLPQFVLAMVLACYVGFSRLYHLRFLQREPMLTKILGVLRLPPQSTFWRFLRSLHLSVAGQLLTVQARMRARVWEAVEAYENLDFQFILVARKTSRLVDQLKATEWKRSPRTDADGQCESDISPRDGARPTGSWRCAMRRSRKRRPPENRCNTRCLRLRSIPIGCS